MVPPTGGPAECLISVDVEAAGPSPSRYALLSIGACVLDRPDERYYVELRPTHTLEDPKATAVHGLSLERLQAEGVEPETAMAGFERWVQEATPEGAVPVFVGFNAAFDWMFVADYFHRYLGRNPFGHAPLDIKAFYMGRAGVPFSATTRRHLAERYPDLERLEHHALADAVDQAALMRRLQADRLISPALPEEP